MSTFRKLLSLSFLAATAAGLAACRQDMHNAPFYRPLRETKFFSDGRSSRDPVKGTVPRGYLQDDKYFFSGKLPNGQTGDIMPFPVTEQVLRRGQERFNIYCRPCHSANGDGNGMIVQRGYRKPTAYSDPRIVQAGVGHYYDVMTNGYGAMPDYAAQVAPVDRWAIAAYIRALQLTQGASIPGMTPQEARAIERTMQAGQGEGAQAPPPGHAPGPSRGESEGIPTQTSPNNPANQTPTNQPPAGSNRQEVPR